MGLEEKQKLPILVSSLILILVSSLILILVSSLILILVSSLILILVSSFDPNKPRTYSTQGKHANHYITGAAFHTALWPGAVDVLHC